MTISFIWGTMYYMKIIVATPLYPPEIERLSVYSKDLAKHLQADHQVTVLVYANQVEENANINIIIVDKAQPLFIRLFKYTWSLFKLAKKHDLIYVQNAVAAGLPAIIVKYLIKKPVIINFAEDEAWKRAVNLRLTDKSLEEFLQKPNRNGKISRIIKIQTWVLRRATKVIVSSDALAKVVAKAYKVPEENIVVNYIPEDREQKLDFATEMVRYQIYTNGPLMDWTGMEDVIKVVAKLKKDFNNIKLIISSDGPNKNKLLNLVKELNLVKHVDILGQISKAEEWYLFKTSQVYIHNFSGLDLVNNLSKSFLSQTAVIVKDTEFNREILGIHQCGLLSKDDDNLIYNIKQLFEDDDLRQELIHKASGNLEAKFSWSVHISKLNNILTTVCRK